MIPWKNMKDNPCTRECPNRKPGCHGSCEDYQAYKKRNEDQKKAQALEKETKNNFIAFKLDCIRKTMK